jgi:hypothetical protein
MLAVNYRELRQMYESLGAAEMTREISEWLRLGREGESGGMQAEELDLCTLAEALVGREWVSSLRPSGGVSVMEAGEAVDTSAFRNITGQIFYSQYLQGYNAPEFVFTSLTRTQPTSLADGEKIPGITQIKEEIGKGIKEGMPYPRVGYGENYVQTPALRKDGAIMALTKEMIWSSKGGQFLRGAREVGELDGYEQEIRLIDHYIGAVNTYKRNGTSYNTYQTSGGSWVNDQENPVSDYNVIDKSRLLIADMKDPDTGRRISVSQGSMTVVCSPFRTMKFRSILNATEVRTGDGASNTVATTFSNPVSGMFQLRESMMMYDRLQSELSVTADNAKEYWFHFDASRFIEIREGWPMTVVQAPSQSHLEFERDIVQQYKVSSFRTPAIMEPRVSVRNKNASGG